MKRLVPKPLSFSQCGAEGFAPGNEQRVKQPWLKPTSYLGKNLVVLILVTQSMIVAGLLAWTGMALAFLEPEHSQLEAKATAKAQGVELLFRVTAAKDHKLTQEGPWSLTLTDTDGLELKLDPKGQFTVKSDHYEESIPGFRVLANHPSKKSGQVHYKIRAFVCTVDKTRCFPELHSGQLAWGIK